MDACATGKHAGLLLQMRGQILTVPDVSKSDRSRLTQYGNRTPLRAKVEYSRLAPGTLEVLPAAFGARAVLLQFHSAESIAGAGGVELTNYEYDQLS
jgi:hypothetical protein